MFKGDAPISVSAQKAAVSAPSASAEKKLRPFKSRAEVMEIMDKRAGMISSFVKRGKWYVDDSGRMVLRFVNEFDIQSIKNFHGEQVFASVVSQVMGKSISPSDIVFECKTEAESHDVIDDIIGSAEN